MRASPKVPFGRSCQDRCTRSTTTATARRPSFVLITWNFISRRFPCYVLCRLLLGGNRQILKTRVSWVFTSPFEQVIYSPLRRLLAQNSWNEEDHTDYDCAVGGLFWYLLHQNTLYNILSLLPPHRMWCGHAPEIQILTSEWICGNCERPHHSLAFSKTAISALYSEITSA